MLHRLSIDLLARPTGRIVFLVVLAALFCAAPVVVRSAACPAPPEETAAAATDDGLTIERMYRDPRVAGFRFRATEWSPDGRRFAFTWNDEGELFHKLWLWDARRGKLALAVDPATIAEESSGVMTRAAIDRASVQRRSGSGIFTFAWSPDSRRILFVLYGDLFLYDVRSGDVRRLFGTAAEESDPAFSPDGGRIAFVRENDIWTIDLADGTETQVTRDGSDLLYNGIGDYIAYEEVGRALSFWWSPDGERIAFVQSDASPVRELLVPDYTETFVAVRRQARPVAGGENAVKRVGIVSLDDREIVWWGDGVRRDRYIVDVSWRPGGAGLLVLMEPRDLKSLHYLLVDAATGAVDTLFTERDPAWVNVDHRSVRWSDDGRALWFTAERPAWNHIYRYDMETAETRAVTSGAWEVTAFHGIDDDGAAWYTATALEPEQRHLYRTAPDGRTARVTPGEGWYESHPSPDFARVIARYDNPLMPWDLYQLSSIRGEPAPGPAPMKGGGGGGDAPMTAAGGALFVKEAWPLPDGLVRITDSRPADLAGFAIPVPRHFTLESRDDGETIHACVLLPPELDGLADIEAILAGTADADYGGDRHPAIITVHGGGYAQSVIKGWRWRTLFDAYLVSRGYVILDLDYRGSSGLGRDWRTGVHLAVGGPDLEDEMTGLDWLRTLPFVDPDRVGMWGWSYGGYMTALAMLRYPDAFRAGVAVAPVTDWRNYDTHYTEERLGMPADEPAAYEAASPVTYAKDLQNHLLVAHAMGDDNVHFQDTVLLVKGLLESGVDFGMMAYPVGRHGIRHDPSRIHLFRTITRHFDRFLRDDPDALAP